MIRATVWTRAHFDAQGREIEGPKCIFNGPVFAVPRVGEMISVRDGFGDETVYKVFYDFANNELHITVRDPDINNEYGPCMYRVKD